MNGNSNHNGNGHEDYSNGPIKDNKVNTNNIAFSNKESMDPDIKNCAKGLQNPSNLTLNGTSNSPNESEEGDFSSITRRYANGKYCVL